MRDLCIIPAKTASDFPGWRWRGNLLDWAGGTVSSHFKDGH
jgi:hypothetical protein